MRQNDDIERMFLQECRDKKRTASGVYHRASRKGFIRGGVKTQYDFLSTKEKRKLNGEIKVSNMYEDISNIPSFEEIRDLDKESGQRLMMTLRKLHSNNVLIKHWGISTGRLYGLLEKLDLHTPSKGSKPRNPRKSKKEIAVTIDEPKIEENTDAKVLLEAIKSLETAILNSTGNEKSNHKIESGFKIEFSGEYDKNEIENRLLSIAGVMVNGHRYKVGIVLEEVGVSKDVKVENNLRRWSRGTVGDVEAVANLEL